MFQIATSYFYQVRFFKPYMIPVSTAVWDPKWYHNFKGQDHCFIDKNGVINGLRNSALMPGSTCANLCRGVEVCIIRNPETCPFLFEYSKQLAAISFNDWIENMEQCSKGLKNLLHIDRDLLYVLLVHEKYDNPCSERSALLQWLVSNGVDAQELVYPIKDYY